MIRAVEVSASANVVLPPVIVSVPSAIRVGEGRRPAIAVSELTKFSRARGGKFSRCARVPSPSSNVRLMLPPPSSRSVPLTISTVPVLLSATVGAAEDRLPSAGLRKRPALLIAEL